MMTGSMWRSAVAALIFAAHPLHVESVAWVAERKDMLSTGFGLLAIIAYRRYVKHPTLGGYALVACAFACSLMSKPMLVTLPFALLLLDYWPLKRLALDKASAWRLFVEKVPLMVLSVASSVITILAQTRGGAVYSLERLPVSDRLANAVASYGMYLFKTIWPVNLAVIYQLARPPVMVVAGSLIILLLISAMVAVLRRRAPHLATGWLWFLGTLVPVIGLVHVGLQAYADRYMYVPMIGLLLMAVWSVPEPRWVSRPVSIALYAVAAMVIAACTAGAWVQTSHWKNTITLFSHAIEVTGGNVVAHNNLGNALRAAGRYDQAHEHLSKALALNPKFTAIHNNFGKLMMDQRRFADAQRHYEQSLRLADRDASIWNNLGISLFEQGRFAEAEARYRRALELQPHFPQAYVNLGRALAAQDRLDEAIAAYRTAIDQRNDLPQAYANLGAALWNQRKIDDAVANYEAALNLNPDLIDTRINLGVALASQGRFNDAIAQFERALRLDADRDDARQYLQLARQQRDQARAAP